MIGLGGGSLAKFRHRRSAAYPYRQSSKSARTSSALRDEFSIPPDDARFEIVREDGAAFLSRAHVSPDVILVDAFDEVGVSRLRYGLLRFLRKGEPHSMTPDGVLVMNLSGIKSRYAAHIQEGPSRRLQGPSVWCRGLRRQCAALCLSSGSKRQRRYPMFFSSGRIIWKRRARVGVLAVSRTTSGG